MLLNTIFTPKWTFYRLFERYQNDWVFKVTLWRAVKGYWIVVDREKYTPEIHYRDVLWSMIFEIKRKFFGCYFFEEALFKSELQIISTLIGVAEKIFFELKSYELNSETIGELSDQLAISKFLLKNISIDFVNKTIDYDSLFRTFNEIKLIFKANPPSSHKSPLRLAKLYSLLWLYMSRIRDSFCPAIFDQHHQHKTLIIYLIMGLWGNFYSKIHKFYPKSLILQLGGLFGSDSLHLDHIMELVKEFNPRDDYGLLKITKGTFSFFELTRFLDDRPQQAYLFRFWRIRALAELERYLARNGRKALYSDE